MGSGNSRAKHSNIPPSTVYGSHTNQHIAAPRAASSASPTQGNSKGSPIGAYNHIGSSCEEEASLDSFVAFSMSNSNASPVVASAVLEANRSSLPLEEPNRSDIVHPVLAHSGITTSNTETRLLNEVNEALNFTHPCRTRVGHKRELAAVAHHSPVFVSYLQTDCASTAARIKRDASLATSTDEDNGYEEQNQNYVCYEGRSKFPSPLPLPITKVLASPPAASEAVKNRPPMPLPYSTMNTGGGAMGRTRDFSQSREGVSRASSTTPNATNAHRSSSDFGVSVGSSIPANISESLTPEQVAHRMSLSLTPFTASASGFSGHPFLQSSSVNRPAPTIQILDWRRLQEATTTHARAISDEGTPTNRTNSTSRAHRGLSPLVPIGSARAAILSARGRRSMSTKEGVEVDHPDWTPPSRGTERIEHEQLHLMGTAATPPTSLAPNSKTTTPSGCAQGQFSYALNVAYTLSGTPLTTTPNIRAHPALSNSLGADVPLHPAISATSTPSSQMTTSMTALQLTANTINLRGPNPAGDPVMHSTSLHGTPSIVDNGSGGGTTLNTGLPGKETIVSSARLPSPLTSAHVSLFSRPLANVPTSLAGTLDATYRPHSGTSSASPPLNASYVTITEEDRERLGRHSLRMPGDDTSSFEGNSTLTGEDGRGTPVNIVVGVSRPTSSPCYQQSAPVLLPTVKYEEIDHAAFLRRLTPKAAAEVTRRDPTLLSSVGFTSSVFSNPSMPFHMPLPLPTAPAGEAKPSIGLRRIAKPKEPASPTKFESPSTSNSSKATESNSLVLEGEYGSEVHLRPSPQSPLSVPPRGTIGQQKPSAKTLTSMSISSSSASTVAGRFGSGVDIGAHPFGVPPGAMMLGNRHLPIPALPSVLLHSASNTTTTFATSHQGRGSSSAGTNLTNSGATTAVPPTPALGLPDKGGLMGLSKVVCRPPPSVSRVIELTDCLAVTSDGEDDSVDDLRVVTSNASSSKGKREARSRRNKSNLIEPEQQAASPFQLP